MGDQPAESSKPRHPHDDFRFVATFEGDPREPIHVAHVIGAETESDPRRHYALVKQSMMGPLVTLSRFDSTSLARTYVMIGREIGYHPIALYAAGATADAGGRDQEWEGRSVGDVWVHMRHYPDRGLVVLHLVDESTRKTHTYNMTTAIARSMRDWLNARLPTFLPILPDAGG